MNVVMIIPTGIGCEIGGHAGDATPAARLLGSVCDKLILHPNVVNASDINEMPGNALYVEGSMLDRFLQGHIELREVKSNHILLVVNKPIRNETVNAVSAARATLGIDVNIVELETALKMTGRIENKVATGDVFGVEELLAQVSRYKFDALAIATQIDVEKPLAIDYLKNGGVNPWGGIEAITSRMIASELQIPVAHAPVESNSLERKDWDHIADPRMAAEFVSWCYVNCVLKGLHKAPRIGKGLSVDDIDVMVSPYGCWGRPHKACRGKVEIIIVKENKTVLSDGYPSGDDLIFVETYLEAAGVIAAMGEGICLESLHRPLLETDIERITDEITKTT